MRERAARQRDSYQPISARCRFVARWYRALHKRSADIGIISAVPRTAATSAIWQQCSSPGPST
ncbi:MAG: hypothetical protein ACYCVV_06440 [Acidimicrobiales bacterium]